MIRATTPTAANVPATAALLEKNLAGVKRRDNNSKWIQADRDRNIYPVEAAPEILVGEAVAALEVETTRDAVANVAVSATTATDAVWVTCADVALAELLAEVDADVLHVDVHSEAYGDFDEYIYAPGGQRSGR